MALLQATDFQDILQHPRTCFTDPELQNGKVTTQAKPKNNPLPRLRSGGFAYVAQVTCGNKIYAVRLFHVEVPDREKRLGIISDFIAHDASGFDPLIKFQFQLDGIRKGKNTYPLVKMAWVKGHQPIKFLESCINAKDLDSISKAADKFVETISELKQLGAAHGDLQVKNFLITDNLEIRLIDYDGMYVPGLSNEEATELGQPSFQHPGRTNSRFFNIELDNFSTIVIYLSFKAIAADPGLLAKYENGENILFDPSDYKNPATSQVFLDLKKSPDPEVRELSKKLEAISKDRIIDVPSFADLIDPSKFADKKWQEFLAAVQSDNAEEIMQCWDEKLFVRHKPNEIKQYVPVIKKVRVTVKALDYIRNEIKKAIPSERGIWEKGEVLLTDKHASQYHNRIKEAKTRWEAFEEVKLEKKKGVDAFIQSWQKKRGVLNACKEAADLKLEYERLVSRRKAIQQFEDAVNNHQDEVIVKLAEDPLLQNETIIAQNAQIIKDCKNHLRVYKEYETIKGMANETDTKRIRDIYRDVLVNCTRLGPRVANDADLADRRLKVLTKLDYAIKHWESVDPGPAWDFILFNNWQPALDLQAQFNGLKSGHLKYKALKQAIAAQNIHKIDTLYKELEQIKCTFKDIDTREIAKARRIIGLELNFQRCIVNLDLHNAVKDWDGNSDLHDHPVVSKFRGKILQFKGWLRKFKRLMGSDVSFTEFLGIYNGLILDKAPIPDKIRERRENYGELVERLEALKTACLKNDHEAARHAWDEILFTTELNRKDIEPYLRFVKKAYKQWLDTQKVTNLQVSLLKDGIKCTWNWPKDTDMGIVRLVAREDGLPEGPDDDKGQKRFVYRGSYESVANRIQFDITDWRQAHVTAFPMAVVGGEYVYGKATRTRNTTTSKAKGFLKSIGDDNFLLTIKADGESSTIPPFAVMKKVGEYSMNDKDGEKLAVEANPPGESCEVTFNMKNIADKTYIRVITTDGSVLYFGNNPNRAWQWDSKKRQFKEMRSRST